MGILTSLSANTVLWIVLMIVFLIIEAAIPGLVTIWFAAGALVAAFLSMGQTSFLVQVFVALIVSAILLAVTRPLAAKLKSKSQLTANADRYIGKQAVVTETVSNLDHTGRADVLGQDWSVRTENDTDTIEKGTVITVLKIDGAKLIVKRKEEEL